VFCPTRVLFLAGGAFDLHLLLGGFAVHAVLVLVLAFFVDLVEFLWVYGWVSCPGTSNFLFLFPLFFFVWLRPCCFSGFLFFFGGFARYYHLWMVMSFDFRRVSFLPFYPPCFSPPFFITLFNSQGVSTGSGTFQSHPRSLFFFLLTVLPPLGEGSSYSLFSLFF